MEQHVLYSPGAIQNKEKCYMAACPGFGNRLYSRAAKLLAAVVKDILWAYVSKTLCILTSIAEECSTMFSGAYSQVSMPIFQQ